MNTFPIRHFLFFTALFVVALGAPSGSPAQDDIYDQVRFENRGKEAVEIVVWNPRGSRKADRWKVEAGKSLDLVDEKGEMLRIGIISSFIKVGEAPEKNIHEVATRKDDFHLVVWNGKDFEPPTK